MLLSVLWIPGEDFVRYKVPKIPFERYKLPLRAGSTTKPLDERYHIWSVFIMAINKNVKIY